MQDTNNLNADNLIRLPYFDWDKAKDFYYVAKLGSFSEAGKFLNISQSSLSRKIKILEDHLNFKVFTRLPQGLELTRKGEELFAIIERTFLELKGLAYNSAVMVNNGQKRKIRISTTQPIASYILNDHLISYNRLHPEIIFDVIANDQLLDIVINDVDIAIRPFSSQSKGIEQELIFTLEKKLYTSFKYIEKYGEPKSIKDLVNHFVVAQSDPKNHPYSDIHWILRLGLENNETHEPVYTSNSLECLIDAVKDGIGIISCYEEMKIIKENGLKQILLGVTDLPVAWYLNYPSNLKLDKQFCNFKDYLLNEFSKNRANTLMS